MLTPLTVVELGGKEIAIQAAKNFRALRRLGVTIRKTIDTVIATRCIEDGYYLLHSDSGLRSVRGASGFARHKLTALNSLIAIAIAAGFAQLPPSATLSPDDSRGVRVEISRLERLAETAPDRCAVINQIARTWASAEQYPETIAALEKVVDLNAGFDIARDPVFTKLRGSREFEALVKSARDATPPVLTSRLAFKANEGDLTPENLAYDPVRRDFYFGSLRKHKIVRCDQKAFCGTFAEGLDAVLGLKVDVASRTLWAASGGLLHYDIVSGKLIRKFTLPGAHLFNDLALSSTGDVYVTDTRPGTVYPLTHSADALEVLEKAGRFPAANGIALSADQRKLYVASFGDGVSVVDLASGTTRAIDRPPNICLASI
jgi:hypothetical protein